MHKERPPHNCTKMVKTLQETKNKDLIQGPQLVPEKDLMDSMETILRCLVQQGYKAIIINRLTHNQQVYRMEE